MDLKKNKGKAGLIASATAILGLVLTWQQIGGPMPASQASVKVAVEAAEETKLLLLYHLLDELRHRLRDAKQENNQELVIELENRIEEVKRQIRKLQENGIDD